MPPILATADGEVTLGLLPGRAGQELLEEQPEPVLHAAGRLARRLATVGATHVAGLPADPTRTVLETSTREQSDPRPLRRAGLVHGDFGPQNLLLDAGAAEPTGMVDWAFAHIGNPVEDISWAEWTVRTHHAHLVSALPGHRLRSAE